MPKFTLEKPVEEEKPIVVSLVIEADAPRLLLNGMQHAYISTGPTGALITVHIKKQEQIQGIDYDQSGHIRTA